ncbi:MAG: bifunctional 3-deoxy-7-phosphoheptulonate synthase/chorismate mutase [Bacteroidota bacterium]|nr:bifunctional 3-deoxy-7-phosphoheptulonate synthase/chorismate mutase [Bacteroidota bacterium]
MILQLEKNIENKAVQHILEKVNGVGYKASIVKTQSLQYIIGVGKKEFDIRAIGILPGVHDVHRVTDDYKLVNRKRKVSGTTISLGDGVEIGESNFSVITGPCSVESEEQIVKIVEHMRQQGLKLMRGGVFKPRSSPYAFRGLGIEGLKMFSAIAKDYGIKIVTEVMEIEQITQMHDYVDVFQVGARNSQNFNLLHELGNVDKPILLKRGLSGTIEELLQSAEYIYSNGNEKIILCERGIRTYEKAYRNTLDLNAVPILKEKTHLPVVVDPSHGIGIREHVEQMSLAALMAGADGVSIEIHEKPEEALSDGQQTLNFIESAELNRKLKIAYEARIAMRG